MVNSRFKRKNNGEFMLSWKGRDQKTVPQYKIEETADIKSILHSCSYNSFAVFDLDNTVFESTRELGSHQWFVNLCEHAFKVITDKVQAINVALELYHLVQHHTQVQPVQENTVKIIKLLQDINIPVIALTARGSEIITPTLRQLNHIGIDFSRNWEIFNNRTIELSNDAVVFHQGIIFCSGRNKGKSFDDFFTHLSKYEKCFPEHVVMAEDTLKHLISVEETVKSHGASFTGLRYNNLDKKAEDFNHMIAIQQLIELSEAFPEQHKKLLTILKFKSEEGMHLNMDDNDRIKRKEPTVDMNASTNDDIAIKRKKFN